MERNLSETSVRGRFEGGDEVHFGCGGVRGMWREIWRQWGDVPQLGSGVRLGCTEIWEVYVDSGQRRERNHGP